MRDDVAYFLSHLVPGESRHGVAGAFEIQVLNDKGQAIAWRVFDLPGDASMIDGHTVPPEVVAAVMSLPIGFGYYANASGEWVDAWGKPTSPPPSDREQLARILFDGTKRLIQRRMPKLRVELRLRAVVECYSGTEAAREAAELLLRQ